MKYNLSELNRIPRSLALAVAIALVLIASGAVHQAAAQQYSAGPKLNKFAQQGSNAAANTMFSGGRDLIDDAQWAKAEEKFAQYISAYPMEKNLDAAMYWMAYSQYKLSKFNQSNETIDRRVKAPRMMIPANSRSWCFRHCLKATCSAAWPSRLIG